MTTPAAVPARVAPAQSPSPSTALSAAPSEGARKSALLLHALPEADRAWMLERLPEPERAALAALLVELRSLGIPADRALVDEALESPRLPEAGAAVRSDAGNGAAALVALAGADPARLAAILGGEPVMLLVRLLEMSDWPWRAALLEHLGAAKRLQLHAQLPGAGGSQAGSSGASSPHGALLREQLAEAVLRRLRLDEERSPEPVRAPSLLARLLQNGARP